MLLQGIITEQGKLQVFNQPALQDWIRSAKGKDINLTLELRYKKRSNNQNAYYWYIVIPMVTEAINHLGNDFSKEEAHEFLKSKFNAKQIEVIDGHYIDMPQSTAKLDTRQFMEYIEKIQHFASQMLNIYIPSPNEQTTIDYALTEHK